MKKTLVSLSLFAFCFAALAMSPAQAQQAGASNPGPEKVLLREWNGIGNKLIGMAEDWPADKYNYRPNDQVRTFGQILLHVAGSNYYATNPALGKSTKGIDENPAQYKTKSEIVAFVKMSFADGAAALEQGGDEGAQKNLGNWVGIIEHCGEHYGNLVTYYRNNRVVPPESRPKKQG